VVPVRLPLKMIKQIAKLSEATGWDRSRAIRWLLDKSLASGLAISLLRPRRRRGITGEIVAVRLADYWADQMAEPTAEVKAAIDRAVGRSKKRG
jgi:hypothetical protein